MRMRRLVATLAAIGLLLVAHFAHAAAIYKSFDLIKNIDGLSNVDTLAY